MGELTFIGPRREKTVSYFANKKNADRIRIVFNAQLLFTVYCHTSSLLNMGHNSHVQCSLKVKGKGLQRISLNSEGRNWKE